jgi:hypothetical protein
MGILWSAWNPSGKLAAGSLRRALEEFASMGMTCTISRLQKGVAIPSNHNPEDVFPLFQCWRTPFDQIAGGLMQLVQTRQLSGVDFVRTARLIHALQLLPLPSKLVLIEASLAHTTEDGQHWLCITASSDSLIITQGGSTYEPQGTESESTTVLEAEVGVGTNRSNDDPLTVMVDLENWADEWCDMANDPDCTFTICDEEVSPVDTASAWEVLPDGL